MSTDPRAATGAQAVSRLPSLPLAPGDKVASTVQRTGGLARFNNWLAVLITRSVGTTWAAYLFVLIALVSLPEAFSAFIGGDTVTGIAWFSQSFLQLVLLPLILVGQRVMAEAQHSQTQADRDALQGLHQLNIAQLDILKELRASTAGQERLS
ncbi:MAG: hypothetical protein JOZ87_20490 [Chloroflexi bacterium]|nr:hypothetical protein [Chloroflexota bacterium]